MIAEVATSSGWGARTRYVLAAAVPTLTVVWIGTHRAAVVRGLGLVRGAAGGWLVGALAATAMTWIASAVAQQGAVVERLPRRRLVAVQFAGSAVGHILPAGIGGATVNLRFLRRHGSSRSSAVSAVGLTTLAGVTVHLLTLAVLVGAGFAAPRAVVGASPVLAAVAVVAACLAVVVASVPVLRRWCTTLGREQASSARAQCALIVRRPVRVLQLGAGATAVPALHAVTLAFVTRALHASIGVDLVVGAYFLASAVSASVPSPGGLGALDAALVIALSGAGLTTTTALAAVVAYRLITVWIPLLPSAAVVWVLQRRDVI